MVLTAMFVTTLILTGMLAWVIATMLIDASRNRRSRLSRTQGLRPFRPSIADEAEDWLNNRTG
jgi:hypothetical protein